VWIRAARLGAASKGIARTRGLKQIEAASGADLDDLAAAYERTAESEKT
jgi:hypothetical protein